MTVLTLTESGLGAAPDAVGGLDILLQKPRLVAVDTRVFVGTTSNI